MKKNKIESESLDFIEKHIDIIFVIFILIISYAIRYALIPIQSGDYRNFLQPWFEELKEGGGLKALGVYSGNYNAPYVTIMALLTYINVSPIASIKLVSIIFDYILAAISAKLIYKVTKSQKYAIVGGIAILFIPTLVLNGSAWAQCDVIYTTFIVLAFYYLYKEKMIPSFLFLGVAFAFKLQFIFVLPAYIMLYFSKKNFSILHFLIIPAVNIVLCLPAMIVGKPLTECLSVYFNQTSEYSAYLTLNMPNFYDIISGNPDMISKFGIGILLFIFGCMLYYVIKNKVKIDFQKMMLLSIISILLCNFFLPQMHERYMFTAEILTVIYAFCYKKNILEAIGLQLISLSTYTAFLFGKNDIPYWILSILLFTIIISLMKKLYKDFLQVQEKNT